MRNYFSKIALVATLGLALALTIPCFAADKELDTRRWRHKLQNDWLVPGKGTEMVRIFARIEALFDKCDREGKTSPAKPGRWRRIMAEGWIIPGKDARYVQENAMTELISEGCLDEAY